MLSTKPIDGSQLTFRYSGAAEHFNYNRETEKREEHQTRDPDTGQPMWKVRCVAVYKSQGEHGEMSVTVPSLEPPTAEFDSEIMFTGLTVKDWAMNGNQGQTWHAATFTAVSATSAPSTKAKRSETAAV